jgi:hypothetical protein
MKFSDLLRERNDAKTIGFQAGWYAAMAYLLEMMPVSADLMDAVRAVGETAPTPDEWADRAVNGNGHSVERN